MTACPCALLKATIYFSQGSRLAQPKFAKHVSGCRSAMNRDSLAIVLTCSGVGSVTLVRRLPPSRRVRGSPRYVDHQSVGQQKTPGPFCLFGRNANHEEKSRRFGERNFENHGTSFTYTFVRRYQQPCARGKTDPSPAFRMEVCGRGIKKFVEMVRFKPGSRLAPPWSYTCTHVYTPNVLFPQSKYRVLIRTFAPCSPARLIPDSSHSAVQTGRVTIFFKLLNVFPVTFRQCITRPR